MHVPGKGGRLVPILLSKEMETVIHLLTDTHEIVGDSPENLFIFAALKRKSKKVTRGSKCLSTVIARTAKITKTRSD